MRRDTRNRLILVSGVIFIVFLSSRQKTGKAGQRGSKPAAADGYGEDAPAQDHEEHNPNVVRPVRDTAISHNAGEIPAGGQHGGDGGDGNGGEVSRDIRKTDGPNVFLLEPPNDGLHRLSHFGIPEAGERRWIVGNKFYEKPAIVKKWDVDPPKDIKTYDGPKDPMKTHAFNERVSNEQDSNRTVPDTRHPVCRTTQYDVEPLPTTSVIVCFHNEARSTLLRTVRSIVDRSPPEKLVEVILVDDASDWPIPLDIMAMEKVVGIRLLKREGLIRARTIGAQAARGEVLTFLDSHVECNTDWLLPLLTRIHEDYRVVVTPVIDLIDDSTFRYGASPLVRGGFNWALTFKWKSVSRREQRNKQSDPVLSPTMAGGLFSIHRKFFIELGTYDLGMDIWGGENLEISFRIWQCHGRLEIMPCSRVGHVFRKRHPYKFPGGGIGNIFLKNTLRAGLAWMDDYIQHFYDSRGGEPKGFDHGDLSERMALRERLQCHDFEWYLKNVFPEMQVPNKKALADGELKTKISPICADSLGHHGGQAIGLYPCHGQGGNQAWTWTMGGELRHDDLCVDAVRRQEGTEAILRECGEDSPKDTQIWEHDRESGEIANRFTNLCLDRHHGKPGGFIKLFKCQRGKPDQRWQFGAYHENVGKDSVLKK